MEKIFFGIVVALALCVDAPFAQDQPSTASKTAEPAHNVFVLTGCITEGSETTTPTFKLTDASSIGQPVPGRAAGSSAVGTSGQKDSYELRPVSGIDAQGLDAKALMAHLNERVELVVRLIETPAPAPPTGAALAQTVKPSEPAPQRFSVTEIRRVLGTCRG